MPVSGSSWRIQPLAGVTWRHPDIDDDQIRSRVADQLEQVPAVTGLADDLEAGALEQNGQTLAEQDIVVGQDHAQSGHDRVITVAPEPDRAVRLHHHVQHYRPYRRAATHPSIRRGPG